MRILVCGGREYSDAARVAQVLERYRHDDPLYIQGGASGGDRLTKEWCEKNGLPCATVYANWQYYGNKAGPIRNRWMLLLDPDVVVAFPGGRGTANMVQQARQEGIPVETID